MALLTGVAAKRAEQQQGEPTAASPNAIKPPPVVAVPVVPTPALTQAEAANRAREQAKVE